MSEEIKELAKRISENSKAIHIARVPDKTKEAFIKLANDEFCGDYGMLLKYLMDDIIGEDTKMIISKLSEHEERLESLENPTQPEDKPEVVGRKMLDGSVKSVREVNKHE